MANRVSLAGRLLARGALRYTPAGVPVVEFQLGHISEREEAGAMRRVDCEMSCIVLGGPAGLLAGARLGDALLAHGFLAARSLKSRSPMLHVTDIEFLEGTENGIQAP